MKQYYLRIEGVNLSNFIYDTQDLSTIRGGGLSLLNSVEKIKSEFSSQLSAISTGASSGLFDMNVSTLSQAEEIRTQVECHINGDDCLRHATFVIDVLESDVADDYDERFAEYREKLMAINRWRQMQSPSIAVPSKSSEKPCKIDMVRPASIPIKYKGEDTHVSESVYYRREYGRERKQGFYERFTNDDLKFVNDLDKLTSDISRGNLHHKMAAIYIDGNSFGKIQAGAKTQSKLREWDDTIKEYRKQMFGQLLSEIKDEPEWMNKGEYRMETLLWGGDELIWIVPAWVGWWTLRFFYEQSKCWEFDEKLLKHAAGIVFCHHNAPIHRITALAKALAEQAKKKNRDGSLFMYQVLESFDHIGKDVDAYIKYTYSDSIELFDLVLQGEDMQEIAKHIRILKDGDFPRGRLYDIVQHIISGQGDVSAIVDRGLKKSAKKGVLNESLKCLANVLNDERVQWIHIAELWDYIV